MGPSTLDIQQEQVWQTPEGKQASPHEYSWDQAWQS